MDCKLVPMDRSHLAGVAALEKLCFAVPWTEAMLAEELYNPAASFIVAEGPAGQVLGYAGLHVVLDEGYIDNVAVRPECRRQGPAAGGVLPLRPGPPGLPYLGGAALQRRCGGVV